MKQQMLYTTVAVEWVISLRDFIWSYAEVSWSLWSRFDLHVFHIVAILGWQSPILLMRINATPENIVIETSSLSYAYILE